MRAVFARGVRPSLGNIKSSTRQPALASTRKVSFPPFRRQITLCDAFAILLAPVLTTAFVIDATSKDRRAREWDRRIAEIESETEALRQREVDAFTCLQHRSVRHGAFAQRRYYSSATVAANQITAEQLEDYMESDGAALVSTAEYWGDEQSLQRRWDRLIALRLAMEMIIHLKTESSERLDLDSLTSLDTNTYPQTLDELFKRLQVIKQLLRRGKAKQILNWSQMPEPYHERRFYAHSRLQEHTEPYQYGYTSLSEYIAHYATIVSALDGGPLAKSYQTLLRAFNWTKQPELSSLVVKAILDSKQLIDESTIGHILFHYSDLYNFADLYAFLERLVHNDKGTSTLEAGFCALYPWIAVQVDGLEIIIPASKNPELLGQLIRATLHCQQIQHAERYLVIIEQRKIPMNRRAFIVNNFLGYCTTVRDWSLGKRWIRVAKIWSTCLAALLSTDQRFARVILRMLNLCVCCNQVRDYELIINAAVQCGIQLPEIDTNRPGKVAQRMVEIRDDWLSREKKAADNSMSDLNLVTKVAAFQKILSAHDPSIEQYIGEVDSTKLPLMSVETRSEPSWSKPNYQPFTSQPHVDDDNDGLRLLNRSHQQEESFEAASNDDSLLGEELLLENKSSPDDIPFETKSTRDDDDDDLMMDKLPTLTHRWKHPSVDDEPSSILDYETDDILQPTNIQRPNIGVFVKSRPVKDNMPTALTTTDIRIARFSPKHIADDNQTLSRNKRSTQTPRSKVPITDLQNTTSPFERRGERDYAEQLSNPNHASPNVQFRPQDTIRYHQ